MSQEKNIDDCASGADYLKYAQDHGWPVYKNGSYWEVSKNGHVVRVPDCDRPLPAETRSSINGVLIKMGLVLMLICMVCVVAAWTL